MSALTRLQRLALLVLPALALTLAPLLLLCRFDEHLKRQAAGLPAGR